MKNRDRYILKVNEFDMLLNLNFEIIGGKKCIIEAITGEYQYIDHERCIESYDKDCETCIQTWLNKEN